jgi:ribosomal protein L21E
MKKIAVSSSTIALPRNLIVSALAISCAVASLVAMKPAHARSAYVPTAYSVGNLVNVSVIDRNTGQTMPVYRYRGEYWVAGVPGAKYSVSINSRTNERLLAVTSVDGVNVLTGETAGFDQNGYVFNAYQSYNVSGWRKSDHEIAAFNFVASPRSYAERTGRPDNVGTIGVALFRVRYQPRYYQPQPHWRDRDHDFHNRYELKRGEAQNAPAPAAESSADSARAAPQSKSMPAPQGGAVARGRVEENLGTGHGAREYDSVTRTTFERSSTNPAEVIRIRYDSHANLVAMGVIPEHRHPGHRSPNPFPDSFGNNGYVPDPPRWWR